jgi:hypothetical protein
MQAMTKRVIALHKNESLAAVGTATLKIAHEIGNSLNIMTTSLQVMQLLFKEQRQAIDDCAISILCDMTSEVERMKELLAELRFWSNWLVTFGRSRTSCGRKYSTTMD